MLLTAEGAVEALTYYWLRAEQGTQYCLRVATHCKCCETLLGEYVKKLRSGSPDLLRSKHSSEPSWLVALLWPESRRLLDQTLRADEAVSLEYKDSDSSE